jgi:hypothetical protein
MEKNGGAENGHHDPVYDKNLYIAMEFLRPQETDNFIISSRGQKNVYNALAESGKAIPPAISNDTFLLEKTTITYELGIYGVLLK